MTSTATTSLDLYGIGIGPAYDAGAVTLTVERGGIAADAGLRTGDRLVAVDGDEGAVLSAFDSFSPRSFTVRRPHVSPVGRQTWVY